MFGCRIVLAMIFQSVWILKTRTELAPDKGEKRGGILPTAHRHLGKSTACFKTITQKKSWLVAVKTISTSLWGQGVTTPFTSSGS